MATGGYLVKQISLHSKLRIKTIRDMDFKGKKLLITGGTGSFGNAVLKRLLNVGLNEIRIFSRDEKKQDDMRKRLNDPIVKFYIGDVRDSRVSGSGSIWS